MSKPCREIEPTTSPADELFYKGNLLPLHLPPRLQMVQKLLETSSDSTYDNRTEPFEDIYMAPFTTTTTHTITTTSTSTPFESCNISPSGSCTASRELNPDEYFFECSTDMSGLITHHPKKTWSKKLKFIKQLKASRAYLKSLFTKTRCSDEAIAEATKKDKERSSKVKEKETKVGNKCPFGQIHMERYQVADSTTATGDSTDKEKIIDDGGSTNQRRSFSLKIKKNSLAKFTSFSSYAGSSSSSSSSSSANSNGFYEVHLLKRCNSVNWEIESSIQGAIAHCKQSQQVTCSRKNATEVGYCSLPASKTSEDQERPELCGG